VNQAVKGFHIEVFGRLSIEKACVKLFCVLSAAPEALEEITRVVGERVGAESAARGWLRALRHKFHQIAPWETLLVEALKNRTRL